MFTQVRKNSWRTGCGFLALILMVATHQNARAVTVTWDGGDGNWHDENNWAPGGFPATARRS